MENDFDKVFISSELNLDAKDLDVKNKNVLNLKYQINRYSINKNKINIVVHDYDKMLTEAALFDREITILLNGVDTTIKIKSFKVKEKDTYNKVKIKGKYSHE